MRNKRKLTPEEVVRQQSDFAILRAARETVIEQDRLFQEKRRENGNIFFILDTIHPSFYDVFASKLKTEELKVMIKRLDGLEICPEFWKNLSDATIKRVLDSIWDFKTFLEKAENGRVNDFINFEAGDWCLKNFSDFEFPEQLDMFSRFSEEGIEKFFLGIMDTQYVPEISYIFRKLDVERTEKGKAVWQKICQLSAFILSWLIEAVDQEAADILLRKLNHQDKITAICCETEPERMYKVLKKSGFSMMESCKNPLIICKKLKDDEFQKIFTDLKENRIAACSILYQMQYLEAFYHAVNAEDKVCILEDFLSCEDFGVLYEKLSKDEQDEIFELILGEDLRQEKAKLLRQQAVDFLEKKDQLSYFEKVTLRDLQSQMSS